MNMCVYGCVLEAIEESIFSEVDVKDSDWERQSRAEICKGAVRISVENPYVRDKW